GGKRGEYVAVGCLIITRGLILAGVLCAASAAALDVSQPGFAVFWDNGAILGNLTRADCERNRERYLDTEARRLITSGDIAGDIESVPEIRKLLASHVSPCRHVRVSPTSGSEGADYFIARVPYGWVGAATEAVCREIAKSDGPPCNPVRII